MRGLTLICALSAGAAFADDAHVVSLHAAYLSEPTGWCASDTGVPVVISMSGLRVFGRASASVDQPARVTVRRGGQPAERVDVGPLEATEIRSRRGVEVATTESLGIRAIRPRVGEVEPLGTLFAETNRCQSLWASTKGETVWRVENGEGDIVMSGSGSALFSPDYGFLGVGGGYPRALKIGDQVFVVMDEPDFTRTTEAFASPAKEQDQ